MDKKLLQVTKIDSLVPNIFRISLLLDNSTHFLPGQYLKVWLNYEDFRSYSIVYNDQNDHEIDLFIGCTENPTSVANQLVKAIQLTKRVMVSLPYGSAYYRDNNNSQVVIIAEGTGYAYGKSIMHRALANTKHDSVILIWKLRNELEIFDLKLLNHLKKQYENFNFFICFDGNISFVGEYIKPLESNIYLAGSSLMVQSVIDQLSSLVFNQNCIYTDSIDNNTISLKKFTSLNSFPDNSIGDFL